MRRVWFAAVLLALIAWGDPSQLLSQENILDWGTLTDPDGDCALKVEDGRLSFTLIGRHDLDGNLPWNMNAPRVLQEVEGDFIALVSVGGAFKPKGPSSVEGRRPYIGAGFVIWQDEKNYVRLERAAVEFEGKTPEYLNFQLQSRGAPNMQQFKMGLKDERVQIRLERRNGRFHAAASYDGRLWQGYEPVAVDLPDRVQIGITAISTSSVPFEPEFEGLEIYRRVAPVGQKNEDAR